MGRHYVWGRKSEAEAVHQLSGPYLSRAIAEDEAVKARIGGYVNVVIRASKQGRVRREIRVRRSAV
jgi:hypothetical protein